jgi:hypothetical protein
VPVTTRILSVVAVGFLAASTADAVPCTPGTLTSYIGLGASGCSVDGVQFSGFTALPPLQGGTDIAPDAIVVVPLSDPSTPGLLFQLDVSAAAAEALEAIFQYTVSAPALFGNILSMSGSSAAGDAAVTVVEDKCLDGSFVPIGPLGCTGTPASLVLFDVGFDALTSAQLSFPGAASIEVVMDIVVDAGLAGSASLGGVTSRFMTASVPEPGAALFLAGGLAGAVLLRRRARYP